MGENGGESDDERNQPMTNQLEHLRTLSSVVADTGDIEAIARFRPLDATTNPSLLLKAASLPAYAPLIDAVLAQTDRWDHNRIGDACDPTDDRDRYGCGCSTDAGASPFGWLGLAIGLLAFVRRRRTVLGRRPSALS